MWSSHKNETHRNNITMRNNNAKDTYEWASWTQRKRLVKALHKPADRSSKRIAVYTKWRSCRRRFFVRCILIRTFGPSRSSTSNVFLIEKCKPQSKNASRQQATTQERRRQKEKVDFKVEHKTTADTDADRTASINIGF